jgi:hypothetical protein
MLALVNCGAVVHSDGKRAEHGGRDGRRHRQRVDGGGGGADLETHGGAAHRNAANHRCGDDHLLAAVAVGEGGEERRADRRREHAQDTDEADRRRPAIAERDHAQRHRERRLGGARRQERQLRPAEPGLLEHVPHGPPRVR